MLKKRVTLLLIGVLGLPAQAAVPFARPYGSADITEVTAGYIALFTCSAHFIMGRAWPDILAVELVDVAPFNPPEPEIDTVRQWVRASDHEGNTAIAVYRDSMGCTVLPPHWDEGDAIRLPYASLAAAPDVSELPFPNGDLTQIRTSKRQQKVLASAFDGKTFGDQTVTVGTVVIRDGEIVGEQYREGFGPFTGYRTWSTAKSIAATLVGIALKDGLLALDEPVPIPEWQYFKDPRQKITWRNLLNMSSGLTSTGPDTGAVYFGGQDVVSAVTTSPLAAEPGSIWKYANADTLLLLYGLRTILDNDLTYLRYPYDELFHPIGMYHSRYEIDHLGNFIGSSQMYTTARDLARFGLLYLQAGVWQGEQILPEGWTEFVATSATARPRQEGERGYGGQFWLLDRLEGVPAGTYTTAGNKGQFATIVPSESMVIVRTGVDPNGVRWQQDKYLRAVIDAFGR